MTRRIRKERSGPFCLLTKEEEEDEEEKIIAKKHARGKDAVKEST